MRARLVEPGAARARSGRPRGDAEESRAIASRSIPSSDAQTEHDAFAKQRLARRGPPWPPGAGVAARGDGFA